MGYPAWLSEDVHGIDDERFRQVRGYYTDAQIVELTLTVNFFNYFTRFEQAVHLPVESWALDSVASLLGDHTREEPRSREPDFRFTARAGRRDARRQESIPAIRPTPSIWVSSQRAMNLGARHRVCMARVHPRTRPLTLS